MPKRGRLGCPLKPLRDDSALGALSSTNDLRDDSALRALSSLRSLRGAPEVPPLCRGTSVSRTTNVGTVGKNWLRKRNGGQKWVNICLHDLCVLQLVKMIYIQLSHQITIYISQKRQHLIIVVKHSVYRAYRQVDQCSFVFFKQKL